MTLHCREVGRGNWRLRIIVINDTADLFRFRPEQRFTWGDPPVTLRIVRVLP